MNNPNLTTALSATRTAAATTPRLPVNGNPEEIKKAAKEFEAVFLTQMLETMFEGIGSDGVFGGGYGEDVFRPMMLQEYGKVLAKSGGIGIADAVGRELMRMQETSK
jgi:peptidoglycan hydrolase FlgJ